MKNVIKIINIKVLNNNNNLWTLKITPKNL